MEPSEITARLVDGLLVSSFMIFIALTMIVYFDFIRQVQKNAYIEWDIKTITAGDYSVEFDLPEGFYDKWISMHMTNYEMRPPAEVFKEWMTDEMEYVLT
mmetsp:Transcript_42460/g.30632  ORF Transcript_42460/g.30632 Transcript_42460/m.30632 type:complete len:100 (+) Transcript_42460:914-1213(+)